jgi:hypothetical protein
MNKIVFSTWYWCFGSGSGFNQVSGSGSRRAKMTHKNIKKFKIGTYSPMIDPDQESMNPDPKHCLVLLSTFLLFFFADKNESLG